MELGLRGDAWAPSDSKEAKTTGNDGKQFLLIEHLTFIFIVFYNLRNQVLPVPERRGVHVPIKIVWQHDHYLLASHKMLYHSPT